MAKKKEYKLESSPFYNRNMKLRSGLSELQASSGESIVLAKKRYFRKDEYIKFIIAEEFDIQAFHNLPNMAKSILQYILYYCLEYNTPYFTFKAKEFALIIKTDVSFVHKGKNKLIDANIIAKTSTREVYWINHNLYYKGNFIVDKYLITK